MDYVLFYCFCLIPICLILLVIFNLHTPIIYFIMLKRYNYYEPKELLWFKEALQKCNVQLALYESIEFSTPKNYVCLYWYLNKLMDYWNISKNSCLEIRLTTYYKAIITYWIKEHNKSLMKVG